MKGKHRRSRKAPVHVQQKKPGRSEVLDYITCPYPTTANFRCRTLISIGMGKPERCPSCGRGI